MHKLPDNVKALTGTARPDRASPAAASDPDVLEETPPAPDWLPNAHAIKEWNRLAPILVRSRRLTDGALSALGHLCALHGKVVQLWAAGETPTAHMLAQYNKLIDSFGITPKAAGKLSPVDESAKPNKFGKFKNAD